MGPRPDIEEWAEKRPFLTIKQRTVYLYLREQAARGADINLKTMGRELGLDYAKRLWESKGALSVAELRTVIEQLESRGLVTFDSDEERVAVLGKVDW
jgi:hypothetical protein